MPGVGKLTVADRLSVFLFTVLISSTTLGRARDVAIVRWMSGGVVYFVLQSCDRLALRPLSGLFLAWYI